jgi:hypothetical protein
MISEDQKTELVDLMKETEADTKKFLEYLDVAVLDDLPAARFNAAKQALLAKKQKVASK